MKTQGWYFHVSCVHVIIFMMHFTGIGQTKRAHTYELNEENLFVHMHVPTYVFYFAANSP